MKVAQRFSSLHAAFALSVVVTLFFGVTSASASSLAVVPIAPIVDSGVPYALTTAWDFTLTQSYQVTALDLYSDGTPYTAVDPVACGRQALRPDTPSEPCWRRCRLGLVRLERQTACSIHPPSPRSFLA